MNQLIQYLLKHLVLDFEGDLSVEMVRDFLRDDHSAEARALLQRVIEDKGVDDLLITLADCLKDHVQSGITAPVVREQIRTYAES